MLYFLLSDNQVIIQDCIDELKSTEAKENTVSYLGRMVSKSATFFSKANFTATKTEKMESKLDEALANLQKASYLTLSEKDLVPLGDLKKAINGSSLPDSMQFKKAEILKIVDRLEEIISKKNNPLEITIEKKTYSLPLEILTNIASFTTDSKLALTAPAFLQAKQDMAKTTAEACQRSSLLKDFLPDAEEILLEFSPDFSDPYDTYVKFVFKSMKLWPLSAHPDLYDEKIEELEKRYGNTMPIQRLEAFALWRENLPPPSIIPNLRLNLAK